jgi:eukaryotic-like serine/threonine-protein kinase
MVADSSAEHLPNVVLGRYRIIEQLARGGMGVIQLAVNQGPAGFNKLCVVKELSVDQTRDPKRVEMFFDEARLCARMNHANVIQTHEVGSDADRHFIVMEYLDGQAMHVILRKMGRTSRQSRAVQLRILSDMLLGLEHAHSLKDYDGTPLNIVHRDVSPQNVIVTYDGIVKILDFGIAKSMESEETRDGIVKGKLVYMAPEQASGGAVDRRTDVFAAGIMLWECITGTRMWGEDRDFRLILRVATTGAPPIRAAAPDAPEALLRICERALAQDPADRFQSATEFRAELEAYIATTEDRKSSHDVGVIIADLFVLERSGLRSKIENALRGVRRRGSLISLVSPDESSQSVESSVSGLRRSGASAISLNPMSSTSLDAVAVYTDANSRTVARAAAKSSRGRALVGVAALASIAICTLAYAALSRKGQAGEAMASAAVVIPSSAVANRISDTEEREPPDVTYEASETTSILARAPRERARPSAAPKSPPPAMGKEASSTGNTPPPTPDSNRVADLPPILRLGDDMKRPQLLSGSDPKYTPEALAAGVQGTMVAKCVISAVGALENCKLLKTLPYMEHAVLASLATRRYTPVVYEGRTRALEYIVNIKLVIPESVREKVEQARKAE